MIRSSKRHPSCHVESFVLKSSMYHLKQNYMSIPGKPFKNTINAIAFHPRRVLPSTKIPWYGQANVIHRSYHVESFALKVSETMCLSITNHTSVTDMQHYYHARYPTDNWHLAYMFSLVYFSVYVCLVGVFPHSASTRRGSMCQGLCTPHAGFPPHENTTRAPRALVYIWHWLKSLDRLPGKRRHDESRLTWV